MIDYAKNNKIQFAQDVFLMATITIAALTGASVFGVAGMLAKEFIKRYLRVELAHLYDGIARGIHQDSDTLPDDAWIAKIPVRMIEICVEISAGAILSADISSAYHHVSSHAKSKSIRTTYPSFLVISTK